MLQSHFSTILLMRLGSTKRIEQCYNTRTLSFGCAANWVDYSKTGDKVTGDQLECVFAHLKNGDSRMNVKDLLVSGVHDPVLSGATNRFLSENRKPIDRIS